MLQFSFILLTVYIFIWFTKAIDYAYFKKERVKRQVIRLGCILFLWCSYIFLVGYSGFLKVTSLPPRMPLFLVFPIFGFIIWFFVSKRFTHYFKPIPICVPLFFQSFRIFVEGLIWWSYLKGLSTVEMTFEGYNYEIIFGLTAIIIGLLAYHKLVGPKFIIFWNVIGLNFLAVIVGVFVSIVYFPIIWGYKGVVINPEFMTFPYMLIPALYMPIAVFTHIFSIIQNKYQLKALL